MATRPRTAAPEPPEEETTATRAQTDMDVLPGESIEDWARRKDEEEGIGPEGRYTLVSRHPPNESTDPNMGNL